MSGVREAPERSGGPRAGSVSGARRTRPAEERVNPRTASPWTGPDVQTRSMTLSPYRNLSRVGDPVLTWDSLNLVPNRNGSTPAAAHTKTAEDSVSGSSGIVPALVAAALFIMLLLALYAVLWKCMDSPPRRKKSKLRVRVQRDTV